MQHIHLIGIGGAGLSAIATVLLQQGYTVSGSDMQASDMVDRLRAQGATITLRHQAENITQPNAVVYSSAIPADNPELQAARKRNIPVYKRPAWLGKMMENKTGIAIAGTHGKTTTTAMTAFILTTAQFSPTYIIGGFVPQLDSNASAGTSDLFVIEADEYDHTFLSLKADIAVITNIEWDHPDIYPSEASLFEAFEQFANLVPKKGKLIACGDDAGIKKFSQNHTQLITYGFEGSNNWQAINLKLNSAGCYTFDILYDNEFVNNRPVNLAIPGMHNVQNGLAAIIAATSVGVSENEAINALSQFRGTGRRFELKGEIKGITVIDDYAHHPTEIKAALSAARAQFGQRSLWAVFQPHTFSRTKLLLNEFAQAFDEADQVIVLDIFPSREADDGTISSADIVKQMAHPSVQHIASMDETITYLQANLSSGDVLLTLGAGDGYKVGEAILNSKT